MKRSAVTTIVGVVLVVAIALAAGCGSGDTKQAQQYMKQGDTYMKQLDTLGNALSTEVQQVFSSVTNAATFNEAVTKVKASVTKISQTITKAQTEYKKINSLQGVEDYKKYADLQLVVLKLDEQLVTLINKFLDASVAIVNNPSGTPEQLTAAQQAFVTEVNAINEKLSTAQTAASKFKSEKNL